MKSGLLCRRLYNEIKAGRGMLKIAISDDNEVVTNQIEKLLLDVCVRGICQWT